jgi:hypothetical protein
VFLLVVEKSGFVGAGLGVIGGIVGCFAGYQAPALGS